MMYCARKEVGPRQAGCRLHVEVENAFEGEEGWCDIVTNLTWQEKCRT